MTLASWAGAFFLTEASAWPLGLWISATLGSLTLLRIYLDPELDPDL